MSGINPYPALRTNSFFDIKFRHIPTNETVAFEGWVTQFADNYSSTWNTQQVYGRMDPLATFQGTTRSIQVGFDIVNDSPAHAVANLKRIGKLIKFLYPVYEDSAASQQNVLKAGPLLGLQWSNLIQNAVPGVDGRELIGFINGGFSYAPDITDGGFLMPSIPVREPTELDKMVYTTGASRTEDASAGKVLDNGTGIRNYIPKKVSLGFTYTVLHTHLVGWSESGASGGEGATTKSFQFGSSETMDPDFPHMWHSFPEVDPEKVKAKDEADAAAAAQAEYDAQPQSARTEQEARAEHEECVSTAASVEARNRCERRLNRALNRSGRQEQRETRQTERAERQQTRRETRRNRPGNVQRRGDAWAARQNPGMGGWGDW